MSPSLRPFAHRRPVQPAARRRRLFRGTDGRQRGAALIEAAFVTPVFFLLVLGLFDGSYALFGDHVVRGAAASGARTASALANEPNTDFRVLAAVRRDVGSLGRANLVRVVVYNSSGLGSPPTESCRNGTPQANVCNVYQGADLDLNPNPATYDFCNAPSPSRYWCPPNRATTLNEKAIPPRYPSYVGVWVLVRHEPVVGVIIDAGRTISHHSVLRIEPRTAE